MIKTKKELKRINKNKSKWNDIDIFKKSLISWENKIWEKESEILKQYNLNLLTKKLKYENIDICETENDIPRETSDKTSFEINYDI